MRILVTGGAGFIGSHVVNLLCDKGIEVVVIDNLSYGYRKFVDKRAEFIYGSIGNDKLIDQALQNVSVVIHLAAYSILGDSFKNPCAYFENNVMNGITLLEGMRKRRVKKIIYSSTAAVYGNPQKIPIKEQDPQVPTTIYGASKLSFEKVLHAYYNSFGIESVILRYFNVYGPRDEQSPATRAVPMWIKALITDTEVKTFWKRIQTRDYVHVQDVAQAHFDVLHLAGIHCYNIGSGKGTKMEEIKMILQDIAKRKLKEIDAGQRKGDPMKLVADISEIKKKVDWYPKNALIDGLRQTYQYYASRYKKTAH